MRNKIKRACEDTFERYGCKPLETPTLNMYELMSYKYGGGDEILKEIYTLQDQGKRELALRYDLTIPFAKVVAMNPNLRLPFKRYEIGKDFEMGQLNKEDFVNLYNATLISSVLSLSWQKLNLWVWRLNCSER